eukprot:CAMPEP_0197586002 /NCGR_PEP_ID=MMETSP1326-20131121/8127_1 /TAXON_ID=1155430 /ORGANISM="Genus nov. species nov., Strain RCC2288" /LENGTH=421 /DNA_ID=CAMNT_0043150583 /DNA_START=209 /DNA_END=1470 /DNA_ORIENTATION=+
MEECCVSLGGNTFSDDELADVSVSARARAAASASPNVSDTTVAPCVTKARAGFSASEEGLGVGAPGTMGENDCDVAARDRTASSLFAESTGASLSGRSAATIGRLTAQHQGIIGSEWNGFGGGLSWVNAKRKGTADHCDSLSSGRTVRPKDDVNRYSAVNTTTTNGDDAPTTSSEDNDLLHYRAPSEELSDATAKPATPDIPNPTANAPATTAAAVAAEVLQGCAGSSGDDSPGPVVDTAAAIKGVLEGLALDGGAGDDHVDIPNGMLAVPLLRHQRRALSWMKRREASGSSPCGGLLADDQGLGKTFSTIALIATNPPPPCWMRGARDGPAPDAARCAHARPGGGTLVVCPTSVLRQWQKELATKLTPSAGLKVLVHHGVGRTKNPADLAEYDVVLTTFAVVGIEVVTPPRGGCGGGGSG